MTEINGTEQLIEVEDGFRVWTKTFGGGAPIELPALLILHGGPGMGHEYLENLSSLASSKQKVVLYDQLGCGKSDCPNDPERWKIPRFVREVDMVRNTLNLDRVIILGQSWGGMLTIEYLLTKPQGVIGAILSNSLSSAILMGKEIMRLKNELPQSILDVLKANEIAGTTDSSEYKQATAAFYSRHIFRMDPLPQEILEALQSSNQVYEVMWGKNEFSITGNLKSWDRTADLNQIELPVKVISGEFDESTPEVNRVLSEGLVNSDWTLMPGCSHLPNLENPQPYMALIQDFMDKLNSAEIQ
jgi:proline-specific peptidase